jgi:hypothetical protein
MPKSKHASGDSSDESNPPDFDPQQYRPVVPQITQLS